MTAKGNFLATSAYEYQAKETDDGPRIHSYALELVSHICNNYNEVSSIDSPLPKYHIKEPEQERLIRVELRHRFYCAKAIQMPVKLFAKKLVEDTWGGELIQEEIKEEELPITSEISHSSSSSSSACGDYGIMDVHSAALTSFMEDDDDHFLFPTDQLEEELATANQEMMMTATVASTTTEVQEETDNHTVAESVPSLQTAVTTSAKSSRPTRGERAKRGRQLSPEPTLQSEPAATASSTSTATPAVAASTSATTSTSKKKAAAKKKASTKKKVEPLAKQVIPGSGRGARQKMFTWVDRMVQLADYKKTFGHIAIPTVRRDPYYNLGLWLAAQRSLYRKNSLRKERLSDLRELGCVGFGGPGG